MNVFFHLRSSEICLKTVRIVLLAGRSTHASTYLMSRLVNLLVHGTCLDE